MAEVVKVMPQKDRIELRRIMKARFEILQEQLGRREQEIRAQIQKDIEAQHAASVKAAQKQARAFEVKAAKIDRKVAEFKAKIEEEAQALRVEAEEFQADMREKGVVPYGDGYYHTRNGQMPAVVVNSDRWYDDERFFIVAKEWRPENLNDKVQRAYNEIAQEAGLHKLDLRMKELELSEELATGALGSDEARSFLSKVPTIDNLLPAPSKKSLKQAEVAVEVVG